MKKRSAVSSLREGKPFFVWVMIKGRPRRMEIEAYPTCSDLFVVHRSLLSAGADEPSEFYWSVTHVESGFAAATYLPSRRVAEIVAGVLAASSIPWDSLRCRSARDIATLRAAVKKISLRQHLGIDVLRWFGRIDDSTISAGAKK